MDFLFSATLIAAFLAGVAALFAPCCITILLPTYFASIFKQKRTVFGMTFIYFLGLVTVFLPIGLGATFLTKLFSNYHNQIFLVGGAFLTLMGAILVSGKHLSLPFAVHPQLKGTGMVSVFVLGIFSAIATTCCAPVLAGVLALSALPGSYTLGAIFTLAYVLGMVAPLFILAGFLDTPAVSGRLMALRRPGSKLANLISGVMFLGLGVLIFYKAWTGQLMMHSVYQLTVNLYIARLTRTIGTYTKFIPEVAWAGLFLAIIVWILIKAARQLKKHE